MTTSADFFDTPARVRTKFAKLVGGDAGGVALVPSASYGLSLAAANVDVRAGQTVVILDEQFPSNVYPWWSLISRNGADLITVPRGTGSWTPRIIDAIDKRTAVVAVPQCHWTDGSLIDLAVVGRAARSVDAALVVDASQSLGAYALNISEVQPDFLVTVGYKWLLGPYRTAFIWVAPGRRDGTPIEYGWLQRDGSADFSKLVEYTSSYGPGAQRYDSGETGDFMAMPMSEAALDQLIVWGIEEIAETLGEMTARIEVGAASLGLLPITAESRVPHMIGIRFPAGPPEGLLDRLHGSQVYVSLRGDSMRVSPHLYTSNEDIARLLEVLAVIA